MRAHFEKHGAVHAIWTISILIAVIAWLLLRQPNGQLVEQYFGFASSVASLILAIIAIGYSFISNTSMSGVVTSLSLHSREIGSSATEISQSAKVLASKAEDLHGEVVKFPSTFEAFTLQINDKISQASDLTMPPRLPLGDKATWSAPASRLGVKVAMYIIAKSYVEGASFQLGRMFLDEKNKVWDGVIAGAVMMIESISIFDIKISNHLEDEKLTFLVETTGKLDALDVIKQVISDEREDTQAMLKKVDEYMIKRRSTKVDENTSK